MDRVRDNSVVDGVDDSQRSKRYWLHLVDNLFRRLPLYLVPIVVMLFLGATLAQNASDNYVSGATIDASENPLVGQLDVRGAEGGFRQTASQTTADFIGEQLRTDVFASDVAEAAGLGDALANNLISPLTIRNSVTVRPNGDSIIAVRTTWSDPVTAQLLGQATIDTYRDYVVETVASDGVAAVDFYTALQEQAQEQVAAAQKALQDYVVNLPPLSKDETRPIEQDLTIQRLNSALDRAEENVQTATSEIETARLQVAQSRSEAGQSVRVIDPPSLPVAPQPKLVKMLSVVMVFGVLGLLISATALVLTTALDRTIRFDLDVVPATNSPIVATVPVIDSLLAGKRRFGRRRGGGSRRRRRGGSAAEEAAAVDADVLDDELVDEADESPGAAAETVTAVTAETEADEAEPVDETVDETAADETSDAPADEELVDEAEIEATADETADDSSADATDEESPADDSSDRDGRPVTGASSGGSRNGNRRNWRTKVAGAASAPIGSGEARR